MSGWAVIIDAEMNLTEAKRLIGSIGYPSKLPGTSYGLSAHDCIAGKRLAALPGTVCSSCYALRDRASWSNAQKAYARRLKAISDPGWVGRHDDGSAAPARPAAT